MTKEQEQKYKEKRIDIMLNEQYNLEAENAFSIELIFKKRKEREEAEERTKAANKALKELEEEIEKNTVAVKGKKAKVSEEDKKRLGLARNKFNGEDFILKSLQGKISKLNEEVAQKANSIRAIKKNVVSLEALDLSSSPKLDYLEINGTHYVCEDNAHKLDADGSMILFIKSNGKTDTTPKSA